MTVAFGISQTEAMGLAIQLKRWRQAQHLNMRQAALAAGVSLATYSRAERADRSLSRPTITALNTWLLPVGRERKRA